MNKLIFNPFDPAFRSNPYPFYDAFREQDPVHVVPNSFVMLTRFDDVANVLRSNDYSRDIDVNANLADSPTRRYKLANPRGKSMLNLDPPDHTRLRRLVSKSFTPTAIEKLRPRISQLVNDSLAPAVASGRLELVEDLAFPVPFQVISDLLGMPTVDGTELRQWSQIITATLEPTTALADLELAGVAISNMRGYLDEVIEHRRGNLTDDMLSSLISVEEQGEKLDNEELMAFVILLYIAGHETTVNLIGNSVFALLTHPDQLAMMRERSCTPGMVDELLRFNGPVQHTIRTPVVDVSFQVEDRQIDIPKGALILASLAAADHDPTVFENPNVLDFSRTNANRHLAFSAGIHYCLGASLARLETEIAIGTLVKQFPNISIDEEPQWSDRLTIRGATKLQLLVS